MQLRLLQDQAFLTTESGDVFLIRVLCVHSCLGCILPYWLNKKGIAPGGRGWGKDKIKSEVVSSLPSPSLFPSPSSLLPFLCFFLPFSLKTGTPCVAWLPTALNLICGPDWPFVAVPCFCFPMLEFFFLIINNCFAVDIILAEAGDLA